MLVPLIRTLQKYLPHTKLTWIIANPAYELVANISGIEFIVIDKPKSIVDYWRFWRRVWKQEYDVLLATQSSFRANLLYALIKAKRKIGYDSLRAKDGHQWFINETIKPGKDHTLDGFLRFAKALGINEADIRWDLPIKQNHLDYATKLLGSLKRPLLLINPAASKPERSWHIAGYIAVAKFAQQKFGASIVLVGGPSAHDFELGCAIENAVDVLNLIGKTKIPELLAIISLADAIICPDTGPSHMGVAVSTPVIALHAVTSTDVSGPYTFRHLCVDKYPQAVVSVLNKTLKTNIWGTHAHGPKTMNLVTIPEVLEKIEKIFSTSTNCNLI